MASSPFAQAEPVADPAPPALPPAAGTKVLFARDIKPIFEASCIKCHARGRDKGGFQLETRESLLKGGDSGPAVIVGKSQESHLIALVAGTDPDEVMPKKGTRLTPAQVGLLRAWIDQGLVWDAAINFTRPPALNLAPHLPSLSVRTNGAPNPVDQLLKPYYAAHGVKPGRVVSDALFARRASLDVTGLLPSPEELAAFIKDRSADKRAKLVEGLLADNQRYAENWLSFWNDLLRNDYRGTGYIDGGRKQISAWLFNSLSNNLPYDKFVAALIDPSPETRGFTDGIIWRGVVNASQAPPMQAAQNISQVFMGVNLKCASCHDSFINDWRLADSYGLASLYSDGPLQMFLCDKPTGKSAAAQFIYPQLGEIDAKADKAARLRRLAEIISGPKDGRLTRTVVNRYWGRLFGHALVEPVDDMEQPAWNQDVLDWLAEDFAANHYDLKHLLARIMTSQAYQLSAVSLEESAAKNFVFHGPAVRRMSAEQFRDALGQVTGVWYPKSELRGDTGEVGEVRACQVAADPLMTALGRPNREVVVTTRSTAATTLQALELTNGETLARILEAGAARLAHSAQDSATLVERIYAQALGRAPTSKEAALARSLFETESASAADATAGPDRKQALEDLLWSIAMLPEFQLIY